MKKLIVVLLIWCFGIGLVKSQNSEVELLNSVITDLIGKQDNPDIPIYNSIRKSAAVITYLVIEKMKS